MVVPVSSVSKSVGRGGEERLGQTLWIAVAFGVGFPIHRAALVTGRHEGSTTKLRCKRSYVYGQQKRSKCLGPRYGGDS